MELSSMAESEPYHGLLTGVHTVDVATDGIDFTVVENEAVRVGTSPTGIGVCGEAGVNHGNSRLKVIGLQILIEFTELSHKEHSFIDNGTTG